MKQVTVGLFLLFSAMFSANAATNTKISDDVLSCQVNGIPLKYVYDKNATYIGQISHFEIKVFAFAINGELSAQSIIKSANHGLKVTSGYIKFDNSGLLKFFGELIVDTEPESISIGCWKK